MKTRRPLAMRVWVLNWKSFMSVKTFLVVFESELQTFCNIYSNYLQPLLQICKHFLQTVQVGDGDTKHLEVQLVCNSNSIFHVRSLTCRFSLLKVLIFPLADVGFPMAYSCFVISKFYDGCPIACLVFNTALVSFFSF